MHTHCHLSILRVNFFLQQRTRKSQIIHFAFAREFTPRGELRCTIPFYPSFYSFFFLTNFITFPILESVYTARIIFQNQDSIFSGQSLLNTSRPRGIGRRAKHKSEASIFGQNTTKTFQTCGQLVNCIFTHSAYSYLSALKDNVLLVMAIKRVEIIFPNILVL